MSIVNKSSYTHYSSFLLRYFYFHLVIYFFTKLKHILISLEPSLFEFIKKSFNGRRRLQRREKEWRGLVHASGSLLLRRNKTHLLRHIHHSIYFSASNTVHSFLGRRSFYSRFVILNVKFIAKNIEVYNFLLNKALYLFFVTCSF